MAMGTRKDRERQEMLWLSSTEIRSTAAHPFYQRLNELLDEHGFDCFVEGECKQFYADKMGRPSLSPGMYFRLLLVGYFGGIDSERGIAWRAVDSGSPRQAVTEATRREIRANLRTHVRNRWHETNPPPRAREHSQAAGCACRRVQPELDQALPTRSRYSAGFAGPRNRHSCCAESRSDRGNSRF